MRRLALGLLALAVIVPTVKGQGWPPRNGSSLPATCAEGESYFLTTSTSTQFYECTATDDWTHVVPGAGASAWGDITGTLSSQTDLQTALDAKAASSHAAAHQDGGGDEVSVNSLSGRLADPQYVNLLDEGVNTATRTILNFTGAGVSVADDAGNGRANITIAGGGAGLPSGGDHPHARRLPLGLHGSVRTGRQVRLGHHRRSRRRNRHGR